MVTPWMPVVVLAGFNKGLIAEDMQVFLQEYHIKFLENLTLEWHVLDAVEKVCSPFPSMIFMLSGEAIQPLIFDTDGKIVKFEDLVLPSFITQPHFNIPLATRQTLAVHRLD